MWRLCLSHRQSYSPSTIVIARSSAASRTKVTSCVDELLTAVLCCLSLQCAALAGNYVNFGVFELYGDPALADALDIALKMSLSVPLADIMAFRKVISVRYLVVSASDKCVTN